MTKTATTSPVEIGTPFTQEKMQEIADFFVREGYVLIPGVLSKNEVEELRARLDRAYEDPTLAAKHIAYTDFIFVRLFEFDLMFRDLLVREPMISVFEYLLGDDCHLIANNAVINDPGIGINHWHIDAATPWFPLPDDIERFHPAMRYPTFIVNGQFILSDLPSVEYGPTQVVPGSHLSGRRPPDPYEAGEFEGRGPHSILCEAGDVYLQHPMAWHRGAPNESQQRRYLLQYNMGMRMMAQRFYPFLNYNMPHYVLDGADERLLRALGKHVKGPYG